MQSNISSNFMKINKILDESKVNELNSFLKFHFGGHISCNDLANRLNITLKDAKELTRILLKMDVIEMNFKLDCCDEYSTNKTIFYEAFDDIPNEICEDCDNRCQLLRRVIIVYKVIRSGLDV